MKEEFKENLNKEEWNNLVMTSNIDGGFLQSWEWGEFQQSLGRKIFRLVLTKEKNFSVLSLVIIHYLPLKQNYLYLPRGPVVKSKTSDKTDLTDFFLQLKKIAINNRSMFIRIDPAWKNDELIFQLGFRFSGQVQPKKTLIINLEPSEEELLATMKPKTRYNIKLAQKHGVIIKEVTNSQFNEFWNLMIKTCQRDHITCHPKNYYQQQLKIPQFKLILAYWQNKVIAGAIINDFNKTRTYVHGASDYQFRDKMAPYLLQWEMIKSAKKQGLKFYDFWGIDEANPKWQGITRFKKGFAPQNLCTEYSGAYDLVLKPTFYQFYRLIKK